MPIFEYKCSGCGNRFEHLHKSSANIESVNCPECGSVENKKLFSAFSASMGSSSSYSGGCSDGSCNIPAPTAGCSSGLCGLN